MSMRLCPTSIVSKPCNVSSCKCYQSSKPASSFTPLGFSFGVSGCGPRCAGGYTHCAEENRKRGRGPAPYQYAGSRDSCFGTGEGRAACAVKKTSDSIAAALNCTKGKACIPA